MTTENNTPPLPFICSRCGYQTALRGLIKKHLERKTLCEPRLRNISPEEVLLENPHFLSKTSLATKKKYACPDCQATFTRASALSRHCTNTCKLRSANRVTELERQTETLVRETEVLKHQVQVLLEDKAGGAAGGGTTQVTTNSHNTNCNNNTVIQICAFGNENVAHLLEDKTFMERCLRRRELGVVDYLKRLHFDPDYPQNNNIRVTNYKMPYVDQFDGTRWIKSEKDTILNDMLDGSCNSMDEHYHEYKDEMATRITENMMRMITDFIDHLKDPENNPQMYQDLKKKIYLMMVNESRSS